MMITDAGERPVKFQRLPRRILLRMVVMVLIGAIGAELFARYYLGLGDPPLSIADPQIEYMFKPSSHYKRFGNDVSYNSFSMRSGEVQPKKIDPSEQRILVIGDSIVNGGALIGDSEIATALLQEKLRRAWNCPVFVGNISAGSWGPENELAYTRRYGWFDADFVILVLSSHDYADVPTFEPLVGVAPDFPAHKPAFALLEAVHRYLPRYFGSKPKASVEVQPATSDIERSLRAVELIIADARKAGAKIAVIQHADRKEFSSKQYERGHDMIAETVRRNGIDPIELRLALSSADPTGSSMYLDDIHLSAKGQAVMAEAMFEILETFKRTPSHSASFR